MTANNPQHAIHGNGLLDQLAHNPASVFSNAKVLVIGDMMLDQYWDGETRRISPEAPIPVVNVNATRNCLGGAANVAVNLAHLGAKVCLIGIIGQDDHACVIKQLLQQHGIQHALVEHPDVNSITKLRILSRGQQIVRVDFENAFPDDAIDNINTLAFAQFNAYDAIILSDYNKGTLAQSQALIDHANRAGKPVIIDPKGHDFSRYTGAYLLTPNRQEFEAIVGPCPDEQTLKTKAFSLLSQLNLQALLVTRSEQGMSLFLQNGDTHRLPTQAQKVFDVTGAGDTVIATLTGAFAAKQSLLQATELANTAAGLVVAKPGCAYATPEEIAQALNPLTPKSLSTNSALPQLITQTRILKAQGKRIVFTNGCFDILHIGHIQYLAEAKQLGDYLIVAVNDDASVKRLKGDSRPINTVDNRMAVLAQLKSVDWVISFTDDTPNALITALEPDVLAKGGDYALNDVVGADIVHAYGGAVHVLGLQQGYSTTRIIESIAQQTS